MISRLLHLISTNKKLSEAVKNITGFYPRRIHYYELAFRHKSVSKEIREGFRESNERLEYLGDSILGAVVAEYLYKRFPYKDEGFLTKMRSKIVSKENLAALAKKMGITKLLTARIDTRLQQSSINEDTFEAFIGAIYMDRGYHQTRKFILNRIMKHHIDVELLEVTDTDFKSQFIEWAQSTKASFEFAIADESGKGYERTFTVDLVVNGEKLGRGISHSKKKAEQQASQQALKVIQQ